MKFFEQGFSLVESMIGLAMVGGIGLVLMQQQDTAGKIQTKSNITQVLGTASASIQKAVSNRAVCSKSLEGLKVDDTVPELMDYKLNPEFPDLSDEEFILNSSHSIARIGQRFEGGLELSSMRIVNLDSKDFLRVEYNVNPDKKTKTIGAETLVHHFLLQGKKSSTGEFIDCVSGPTNLVESSIQKACLDLGATWDEKAEPKCRWTNMPKCMISYGSCGAGFVLKDTWLIRKEANEKQFSDGTDNYKAGDYVASLYCCLKDPPKEEGHTPPAQVAGQGGGDCIPGEVSPPSEHEEGGPEQLKPTGQEECIIR